MIRVTKPLDNSQPAANASLSAHHYSIGTMRVVFQSPVASLDAYCEGAASVIYNDLLTKLPAPKLLSTENAQLRYRGEAPFAGKMCLVECWGEGHLVQIDVAGQACCSVDLMGLHIHLRNHNAFDERLNLEVVTGPAMMLMLAHRGIYSLHAGCVKTPYGNIALIAESGAGKSTLSTHVDHNWSQLADDILPLDIVVTEESSKHRFNLCRYPQLKLPNARTQEQIRSGAQLDLLIRLRAEPAAKIEFMPMPKTAALLEVIRHTVAARLFDNQMMRQHVRFAKRLVKTTPVVELAYPRNIEQLPALREHVLNYLKSLN
jgi:hypothetical protein